MRFKLKWNTEPIAKKFQIVEVPIILLIEQKGQSKMSNSIIVEAVLGNCRF
jgi:dolichol-phosphate mannosyltransferase